MIKCTNCEQSTDSIKSVIKGKKIFTGCPSCINGLIQGNATHANHTREQMKREFAKDIAQPSNPREYIKAVGIEKSKEFYNDDTIRKFS